MGTKIGVKMSSKSGALARTRLAIDNDKPGYGQEGPGEGVADLFCKLRMLLWILVE